MDAARKAIAAIRQLSSQVGIPERLRDLGVKEEDFAVMAENAMNDVCSVTNPRRQRKNRLSVSLKLHIKIDVQILSAMDRHKDSPTGHQTYY